MNTHALIADAQTDPETGLPRCPSSETWAALSPAEREQVTLELMAALDEYEQTLPPEGTPHAQTQRDALDLLEQRFNKTRRRIFLATNLMVHYPSELPFAPDLLAVLDVEPGHRMSWHVETEGKGPDFVMEVLYAGDAQKDLKRNVRRLSALGVPEYFVADGRRLTVHGFRLDAAASPPRYVPILPQYGRVPSQVLGIEFAFVEGELKAYSDGAVILRTAEELHLVAQFLTAANARADEEAARADREAARAEQEAARAEQEAARASVAEDRARDALGAIRVSIRALLTARGWQLDATTSTRLESCEDPLLLSEWLARAAMAQSPSEIFPSR